MFLLKVYLGAMLSFLGIIAPILLMYAKAVENSCMMKLVRVNDLTIGDWLARTLRVGKRKILPNWEGLSEKELALIQKKYHGRVLVKQGVPFVPVFFIALIVLLLLVYNKLI